MALLATIFFILHFGIGLLLPYKPGFKPPFYKLIEDTGLDLERRLNRETRPQAVRLVRGATAGLMIGVLGGVAGLVIRYTRKLLHFGFVLQLAFIACCINFMSQMKLVRQVQKHIDANEIPQASAALQPYVLEPLANADGHTVIRKAIEFIAIYLNRFLLAPVFWLLMAGPVGMALYVTFAALRQAFGLPDKRRIYFGQFVRRVDTILNLIPAALSAVFLAASALFVTRSSPWGAVKMILGQSRAYKFHYEGWLIASLAGGLGVTLGGPVRYNADYAENHAWAGPAGSSARLQPEDLARAALLQYVFFMLVIAMVSALMICGL